MTKPRSVVITGLGCISSLGHNTSQFWDAIKSGRAGIGASNNPALESLNGAPVAEVQNYKPLDNFDNKQLRLLDLSSQYSLIAAKEAINNSGLELDPEMGQRTGIILGSSSMAMHSTDETLHQYYKHNKLPPPMTVPKGFQSAPASQISMNYGITGPTLMVNTACASSNHAIGQSMELIRNNQADIVLTGGTDTAITAPIYHAWSALRVLDPVTCRPFSKERQGLILGEGAGIIILEEEAHAKARGAKIYARLDGYGFSADAYDLVKVSQEGAAVAINKALMHADLKPTDIDYINAHGTGTQLNDTTETRIIRDVFGKHADSLLVSSTKSMHGHALGASGALELIATVLALKEQLAPPTANFSTPDSDCDLDYIPNKARHSSLNACISNAFAFGGLNAVLAVTKYT